MFIITDRCDNSNVRPRSIGLRASECTISMMLGDSLKTKCPHRATAPLIGGSVSPRWKMACSASDRLTSRQPSSLFHRPFIKRKYKYFVHRLHCRSAREFNACSCECSPAFLTCVRQWIHNFDHLQYDHCALGATAFFSLVFFASYGNKLKRSR